MSDFEDRFRHELTEAAAPLGPTPGLRGDVDRRIRHHRRVRRMQTTVGIAGAVLLLAGLGLVLGLNDQGGENVTVAEIVPLPDDGVGAPELLPCDWDAVDADEPAYYDLPEITEPYLGLTEDVARAQAADDGREVSVVCRDGQVMDRKRDLVDGRLVVHVVGGEVLEALVEGTSRPSAEDPALGAAHP